MYNFQFSQILQCNSKKQEISWSADIGYKHVLDYSNLLIRTMIYKIPDKISKIWCLVVDDITQC